MLSFRSFAACFLGLTLTLGIATAEHTDAATPSTTAKAPTPALTPAVPTVPASPSSPANPAAAVNPVSATTAPSLPPVVTPAPTGPTPTISPTVAPQGTPLPEGSEPEKSVVQIINAFQEPNWAAPWIFDIPRYASGTGFLIDGDRIMTNAHVVAWAKELLVRRYHDPQRYFAKVEFVAQDIDLAVLKVENPAFYKGMKPLHFGNLPQVRSTVVTYGFPAGGQQISYTRGVVSRIEVQSYVHIGNRSFLAGQTDAAINPGNSGGPVIQDDKVVGVAFEGYASLQGTGYFIPTAVIHHFIDDIQDGVYDGVPDSGLHLAPLQNPAFRRMLKLDPESKRGVRVDRILDIASTRAVLKENDVVMQVGDYPVDDDGTITYEGNTVGVTTAFDTAQNNDVLPLQIWRDGQLMKVNLPMKVYNDDLAQGNQYDTLPHYYVYGGLVFTNLSLDYLKTFGQDWSNSAGRELIYELAYRHLEDPEHWRHEPVVLSSILDNAVNANLLTRGHAMVDKINGMRIEQLSDVPKAFAAGTGPDDIIEFLPDHHFEVLRKDAAIRANPDILDMYRVPAPSRL